MDIKMTLLSDAIFGNGISVPGEEDISVQLDEYGFPYYRGSTFKGVFREEIINYMVLCGKSESEANTKVNSLLGESGSDDIGNKLVFSDFVLSPHVRREVIDEVGMDSFAYVRDAITNVRTFTSLDENGMVEEHSLRMARCINKGLVFYSSIEGVPAEDEDAIRDTLGMIKWIGTMRNRGFGKVKIEEV